jgi:hypothetical protein
MTNKVGLEIILLPIIAVSMFAEEIGEFITGMTVGAVTATATIGSGAVYGYSDAKGNHLPGREYLAPALAVGAFYAGRKFGCDDEKMAFGLTATGIATAIGAASYGAGYLIGKVN